MEDKDKKKNRKKSSKKKSEKVKKLSDYQQTKPVQLALFEVINLPDDRHSNTIELYDAIPKYVWGKPGKEITSGKLKRLKRSFKHKGTAYEVYISPAIVDGQNGEDVVKFPGLREELLEDALRRIAGKGQGLYLDDSCGVKFTMYELRNELMKMGHCFSLKEIKESIQICGKTHLELFGNDGKSIFESNCFETVGLTTTEDWQGVGRNTKAYVRFNSLVTQSINNKTYRLFNYETAMSYRRVLARWLHKRMAHNYKQASKERLFKIKLSTIIRDSGVTEYKKISDNIRDVKLALDEMKEKNVLSSYGADKTLEGRKITEVLFILTPHKDFISEVIQANKRQKSIIEHKTEPVYLPSRVTKIIEDHKQREKGNSEDQGMDYVDEN